MVARVVLSRELSMAAGLGRDAMGEAGGCSGWQGQLILLFAVAEIDPPFSASCDVVCMSIEVCSGTQDDR